MQAPDRKGDKFWIGFVTGMVLPVMTYGVLLFLYDLSVQLELWGTYTASDSFRTRTLSLIALVSNAIAMQYFRRRYYDNAMRGLVFPTLIYAGIWLYLFYDLLF